MRLRILTITIWLFFLHAFRFVYSQPNIIIFCVDLGYADRPNLDQMARERLNLTQLYSRASVCTPGQSVLITGRPSIRSRMCHNETSVLIPFSSGAWLVDKITMAEALREQGYRTGMVGKWPLGQRDEFLPTHHGLDRFGGPYSHDMLTSPESQWPAARYAPSLILPKGHEMMAKNVDQHLIKRYRARAIHFVKKETSKPFFHFMPHIPRFTSKYFDGISTNGLYSEVVELDCYLCQIRQTLRCEGITDYTLMFFASDDGLWLVMDEGGGFANCKKSIPNCEMEPRSINSRSFRSTKLL